MMIISEPTLYSSSPHQNYSTAISPMIMAIIPIASMQLNLISSRLRRVLPVAFLADVPSLFVLSLS